jgi:hypothetical protein
MKSWVSSAFECEKIKPRNSAIAKPVPSTTSQQSIKKLVNDKFVAKTSTTKTSLIDTDLQLCDKYEPKTRTELMVNKTKIEELSNFIDKNNQRSAILLLHGKHIMPSRSKLFKVQFVHILLVNRSDLKAHQDLEKPVA